MNNMNFKIYKHAPKSKNAGYNIYSIRDREKVIHHLSHFALRNCNFYVGQSGRNRVLRDGVKNVHAYIKAESFHTNISLPKRAFRVTYDPFKNDQFMVLNNEGIAIPIYRADSVFCTRIGVYVGETGIVGQL